MKTIAPSPYKRKKSVRTKKPARTKPVSSLSKKPANRGRYVTIYLSASLASHYESRAKTLRTTVGKLIKHDMEERPISFYDKMKEFIGTAEGCPADLSTNPAYLEGMGEDIIPMKLPMQFKK